MKLQNQYLLVLGDDPQQELLKYLSQMLNWGQIIRFYIILVLSHKLKSKMF